MITNNNIFDSNTEFRCDDEFLILIFIRFYQWIALKKATQLLELTNTKQSTETKDKVKEEEEESEEEDDALIRKVAKAAGQVDQKSDKKKKKDDKKKGDGV
jgi:hypothetical protein